MHLETERLYLRPIGLEDKEALFAYRSDVMANQYQGWIPKTMDDVEAFINQLSSEANVPDTWHQLAIVEKESGKMIGDVGLHFLGPENWQVEIGYTLSLPFQKKGYATEALRKVIDFLLNDLKKHRIIASIDPANVDSIRLVERLGFRKEAHFIESIYQNGGWADDVVYALLAREWGLLNK